jgi:ComF family protein
VFADGIFSAFFPDNCRLCELPLTAASRVPVCSDCISSAGAWRDAIRCTLCQREVTHRASLDDSGVCGVCLSQPGPVKRVWTYGPYEGALRQLIHLLKYDGMVPLATTLGERASGTTEFYEEADLVVPVPLHWTRRLDRGFNQSRLLAEVVCRQSGLPCVPRGLRRKRATSAQAGLSGARRRASLRGAFEARRSLVAGRRVLLIDDVVTTGATIQACARALKKSGATQVSVLAVARAQLAQRAV